MSATPLTTSFKPHIKRNFKFEKEVTFIPNISYEENLVFSEEFFTVTNTNSLSWGLSFSATQIIVGNSNGSGFFYADSANKVYIITNKHVIWNDEKEALEGSHIQFFLHCKQDNKKEKIFKSACKATVPITNVHYHPKKNVDLIAVDVTKLTITYAHNYNPQTSTHNFTINEKNLPTQADLEKLSAREMVTMIGYPNGICDTQTKLPLFRNGYTAMHPSLTINSEEDGEYGVVDMACISGSSGSLIGILNEASFSSGTAFKVADRFIPLGILFGGPLHVVGDLSLEILNLGYYIPISQLIGLSEWPRLKLKE